MSCTALRKGASFKNISRKVPSGDLLQIPIIMIESAVSDKIYRF